MGTGLIAARRLDGVAEGMAEVQQPAHARIVLIGGHQRRLDGQAAGNDRLPVGRFRFHIVQNGGVPDQAVFDDLRRAASHLPGRQGGQAVGVHQHQAGLIEGPQQVLALRQIHCRLAAHGAVHLREQRGGCLYQRHAPLIGGGGKARQIAGDAAAQGQQTVGAGKAPLCQVAAQVQPRLRRLMALPLRKGQQFSGEPRVTKAVQHRAAVQRRHGFVRRHRPAADAQRAQQSPGAAQYAAPDVHGIAALGQRNGNGHRLLPVFTVFLFYRTFRWL